MVELEVNGIQIELGEKADSIKYTKQIADIFDIASVATSFTNSFTFPKTPNNTEAMHQLGIEGDRSNIPYEKVPARLSDGGFSLIREGWLMCKETDDNYKGNILNGIIDFFKAIENKTMGVDLDLSNFNHTKDLPSVIDSFTNEYYRYIFADYNGKNRGEFEGNEGINIDYLVPSFNMGRLFELVMSTFGFQFDDANISEINDLWITYPKDPAEEIIEETIATLEKDPFAKPPSNVGSGYFSVPSEKSWSTSVISDGSLLSNWRFVVSEDGAYRINLESEMYAFYQTVPVVLGQRVTEEYRKMDLSVSVNSNNVISLQSDPYAPVTSEVSIYLNEGDIIEFDFRITPYFINQRTLKEIRHNGTTLIIKKTNQGNVSLTDAFKDFQIKDFIKEIIWRTATIPVIDEFTKVVSFVPLSFRVDFTNAVDWSEKFIRRISESYDVGNYAQKNIFSHKYNDDNDVSKNGSLNINNANLKDSIILVDSKIYAPETPLYYFTANAFTSIFKVWERTPKEDSEGNVSIDYKGLNGRFYIMKYKTSEVGSYRLVSEAVGGTEIITQFPYADTTGTTFDQIVPEKWNIILQLLNKFRLHNIELAMTIEDFLSLDLTRPYYFEKEGAYYIFNRVVGYEEGKKTVGEFVKINKV